MKTTAKAHPADLDTAAVIARAVRFDISLFLGTGRFDHATAETLDEANKAALELLARNPGTNRKPLIYAATADGRNVLVTSNGASKMTDETATPKTYDKKFNAQRAARKAGLAEGQFETFKTDDGRFGYRSVEAPKVEPMQHPLVALRNAASEAAAPPAEAPPASYVDPQFQAALDARKARKDANKQKAKEAGAQRQTGKRAAALEAAAAGTLPSPPDFSADTHKPYRKKLAALIKLVEAKNVEGLKAFAINPISTSPRALDRYRNLAVVALEASGRAA